MITAEKKKLYIEPSYLQKIKHFTNGVEIVIVKIVNIFKEEIKMRGMIQKKLKQEFLDFKKAYNQIDNLHFMWFNIPKKPKQLTLGVF